MPAAKRNLAIEQFATFTKRLIWRDSKKRPINLTGWTAKLQMRANAGSNTVLLELSTENGGIVIDPLKGIIDLILTDEQTGALTFAAAVYDLVLTAPGAPVGQAHRLIEGKVLVSPGVTRA